MKPPRRWHLFLQILAFAPVLFPATAVSRPAATDEAAAYSLIPEPFIFCTTCHGVELRGNAAVGAPRLNGMPGWYVMRQMQAFRQGLRGTHPDDATGMEMQPQAAALSDQALQDAVAFVTAVPVRAETVERTVNGDAGRGESLYATCAACHGNAGQGNRALGAPALAGQSDWYLVRQLNRYLAGARGYAKADNRGRQMRAAAGVLAGEADIRDVVAYINTLPAEKATHE